MKTILFLIISIQLFSVEINKYNGQAFELKTGKKIYQDHHQEFYENGKHLYSIVEYKDNNGKVFAKKNINFQKAGPKAEFLLNDYRDGYLEGSELVNGKIKLIYQKNKSEEKKEEIIDSPVNAVLDGGFDIFIRKNWDEILEGKKKQFHICAPSQMDCFKFVAFKTKEEIINGKDAVLIRVELNNFILAALVKPILIHYEKSSKRILQYDGISNINNPEGKSYVVRIVYTYGE